MPITSVEIAHLCNVSRTTVDRALKNKPGISSDTRQRILDCAARHGYRPNHLARSLSTGHSAAVGIIVFDLRNQHFSRMVDAVARYFAEQEIFTFTCISDKNAERERAILDSLVDRQVDGIILLPINEGSDFEASLRALDLPIVTVSNRLNGFPFVGGDNSAAVVRGMQFLCDQGHQTIHFVCPPLHRSGTENQYAQVQRAEGYCLFKRSHPEIVGELISSPNYLDLVDALLENSADKPVFFCSSDHYMLEIRRHLLAKGYDLNECCALMGFDGFDILDQLTPRPSTILYPAESIGEAAAKMLDALMHDRPTEHEILLSCPLLGGSSE